MGNTGKMENKTLNTTQKQNGGKNANKLFVGRVFCHNTAVQERGDAGEFSINSL